jgi:hypothetical protein
MRIVDADRPVHIRGVDRQVIPARALRRHDRRVAVDAVRVHRFDDLASAVGTADDHPTTIPPSQLEKDIV